MLAGVWVAGSLPPASQIAGNLKKYSKRYDEVDASLAAEADTALVAERAALMDDWLAWLRAKRQAMDTEEYRAALVALVCACAVRASVRSCVLTQVAFSLCARAGRPAQERRGGGVQQRDNRG